ncbi:hypothetical protein HDU79_006532 [Rhizoclosmatium sp. JEL0117]|nr:hypothetical protein HDU79_006532 [Rhizoclosmatium sp. JEL0117]
MHMITPVVPSVVSQASNDRKDLLKSTSSTNLAAQSTNELVIQALEAARDAFKDGHSLGIEKEALMELIMKCSNYYTQDIQAFERSLTEKLNRKRQALLDALEHNIRISNGSSAATIASIPLYFVPGPGVAVAGTIGGVSAAVGFLFSNDKDLKNKVTEFGDPSFLFADVEKEREPVEEFMRFLVQFGETDVDAANGFLMLLLMARASKESAFSRSTLIRETLSGQHEDSDCGLLTILLNKRAKESTLASRKADLRSGRNIITNNTFKVATQLLAARKNVAYLATSLEVVGVNSAFLGVLTPLAKPARTFGKVLCVVALPLEVFNLSCNINKRAKCIAFIEERTRDYQARIDELVQELVRFQT